MLIEYKYLKLNNILITKSFGYIFSKIIIINIGNVLTFIGR